MDFCVFFWGVASAGILAISVLQLLIYMINQEIKKIEQKRLGLMKKIHSLKNN